jgi:hypothetical protein
LINNAIHPGEPDGINASLIWIDQWINQGKPSKTKNGESLPVIAFIPAYNIGGMMNRSTSSRANQNGPEEYGWRNSGTIFNANILPYLVDYCREELDVETGDDGKVYKTTYGIERIPDIMAMVEMQHYREGLNVDRLIALGALVAFAKVQEANRGIMKRFEDTGKKSLDNSKNLYKFTNNSPFRHMGKGEGNIGERPPRNPFKNLR